MQHHTQSPRGNPFVRSRGDSCPIQDLPFELLSRLFEFGAAYNPLNGLYINYKNKLLEEAVGEDGAPWRPSTRRAAPFQVAVSHVCRHWRHVAISTASLWTDIRLSTPTHPRHELVSLYLERSKPLAINIKVNTNSSRVHSENLNSSLDVDFLYALLIPHINRWRSVELRYSKPRHISAFLNAISDHSTPSASRLKSIRLYGIYSPPMDEIVPMVSGFIGSIPQLQHLLLFGVRVEWGQMISATSSLTRLELFSLPGDFGPSWAEFATILRGVPQLQKLALSESELGEPEFEPSPLDAIVDANSPVPLLHLTDLVLGSHSETVVIGLLRKLYMPNLKTLILDLGVGDYSDFVQELTRPATTLIPPSTEDTPPPSLLMRLERLAILKLPFEDYELMVNMFDQLRNLKALRLTLRRDLRTLSYLHLLVPITSPEKDRVVCTLPQLESLFVYNSMDHLPLLHDVVERRKDQGVPLKALYLPWDERVLKTEMAWFKQRLETFGFIDQAYGWHTDSAFEGVC